jgi:hypothetical protein
MHKTWLGLQPTRAAGQIINSALDLAATLDASPSGFPRKGLRLIIGLPIESVPQT